MAYSYDIEEVPPADVPCVEHDIHRAKKFLQKHSSESGDSLFDHLTDLLAKILAERPKNAVDIFEEISRKLKQERYKSQTDHLRDLYVPPARYEDAKKLIKLFQTTEEGEIVEEAVENDEESAGQDGGKQNMLDLLLYFEQTDVGLPRSEMIILILAIRKLTASAPLKNVRFWGKILGNPKCYYVVEAELREEELDRRLEQEEAEQQAQREKEEAEAEAEAEATAKAAEEEKIADEREAEVEGEEKGEKLSDLEFPPMPVNTWKPPPDVPPERIGSGTNEKVYFVCNSPGLDEWIELPPVTPQQIVTARQVIRCCKGNLETPVHTFPPFPGTEKNYLRAQIARISGTTHVSPTGYFTFGGEGEEEEDLDEEPAEGDGLAENVHYDPLPVKELVDSSMSNWCHHTPYILKQGRTVWWSPENEPTVVDEELGEEEELEDDEWRDAKAAKESGPALLTPLSEDATVDNVVPWTARQSSRLIPDISVAFVRSNVWPGAFAFAAGRRFANLYIGWGHKYTAFNYSPPPLPEVQDQYRMGPEVMEMQDPTFEEEEAYRIARLPASSASPDAEEEEVAAEEEEEEEDEEDDE